VKEKKMQSLTVFLSAGRSGTQWLAKTFSETYPDLAEVVHEPILFHYRPKATLRCKNYDETIRKVAPLRKHLANIDQILQSGRNYVEAGWPVFSWIPYFHERYRSQLRLVHLTRHPVYFACSQTTHNYYRPIVRKDGYVRYAQLEPRDPGILHKEYQQIWSKLSAFEKCLFQWLEVHEYAFEIEQKQPDTPILRVRMEDLFNPQHDALAGVLRFLQLPGDRMADKGWAQRVIDKYQWKTKVDFDVAKIHDHPPVIKLAKKMGYDVNDYDLNRIEERYRAKTHKWLRKRLQAIAGAFCWAGDRRYSKNRET
jgi:hypothetical protein